MIIETYFEMFFGIAVVRLGKRFVNFVIGNGSKRTAKEFWKGIKQHEMNIIRNCK